MEGTLRRETSCSLVNESMMHMPADSLTSGKGILNTYYSKRSVFDYLLDKVQYGSTYDVQYEVVMYE